MKRVLTDNGSCYRSKVFAQSLGDHIKHTRTRPYRPQTNGKVERFNRTLAGEWLCACLHHRAHTGIGGLTPIERLRVHNLTGKYT